MGGAQRDLTGETPAGSIIVGGAARHAALRCCRVDGLYLAAVRCGGDGEEHLAAVLLEVEVRAAVVEVEARHDLRVELGAARTLARERVVVPVGQVTVDGAAALDLGDIEDEVHGQVLGALQHLPAGVVDMDVDGCLGTVSVEGVRTAERALRHQVVAPGLTVVEPHARDARGNGAAGLRVKLDRGGLGCEREGEAALDVHSRVLGRLEVECGHPGGLEVYGIVVAARCSRLDIMAGHLCGAGAVGEHLDVVGGPGILQIGVGLPGHFTQVDGGGPGHGPSRRLEQPVVGAVAEHGIEGGGAVGLVHVEVVVVGALGGGHAPVIAAEVGVHIGASLARSDEELGIGRAGRDVAGDLVQGRVCVTTANRQACLLGCGDDVGTGT